MTTFGDIELDKDEKSFLALGPDFSIYDVLKMEKIEKEIQITATKIPWSRMGKEPGDITYNRNLEDIIEEEEAEKLVNLNKRVLTQTLVRWTWVLSG